MGPKIDDCGRASREVINYAHFTGAIIYKA